VNLAQPMLKGEVIWQACHSHYRLPRCT